MDFDLVGQSKREGWIGGEEEVDYKVSRNRYEDGSKVNDFTLVLFAGFSLLV